MKGIILAGEIYNYECLIMNYKLRGELSWKGLF